MKSVGEFFERIRGRYAGEMHARTAVRESVKTCVGIDIPLEAISFKPKTIILKGLNQTAKSAVFVKKLSLFKDLESRQLGRPISDIRFEG